MLIFYNVITFVIRRSTGIWKRAHPLHLHLPCPCHLPYFQCRFHLNWLPPPLYEAVNFSVTIVPSACSSPSSCTTPICRRLTQKKFNQLGPQEIYYLSQRQPTFRQQFYLFTQIRRPNAAPNQSNSQLLDLFSGEEKGGKTKTRGVR